MTNEDTMFCRQCQETFGNTGCTRGGVCGKKPATAALMDELISGLEEIAAERQPTRELGRFMTHALFMTITNANFDDGRLSLARAECRRFLGRPIARKRPRAFADADADVRSLKELTLFGLKGLSAYAHHAQVLGREDDAIYAFLFKALKAMTDCHDTGRLTDLVLECGRTAVTAMALLDDANTSAYGQPTATEVDLGVGARPGILVSGHDLKDLEELLEQTKDAGVDVYTHGEMLPAHYYPAFRKYPHLRGNYGGAWHRQQKEFAFFNGAILMTTNCIVPVLDSYRDRIFTTGVVGYPGVTHIADRADGKPKDFSALISCAKRCAPPTELENGTITGGFAHHQVDAYKDRLVAAIRVGKIHKFIVMAGCDGRHTTRSYYTQVAEQLPPDTVILTAGCAKYRYIKTVKGDIDGIPRVLDAGQCNDAYSIAMIAMMLRDALGTDDLNKLPLAFDIAWYEQKAVAVLLALLALGFRNIRLGPTLPAFLSPGVRNVLVSRFGLRPIANVTDDVREMMR